MVHRLRILAFLAFAGLLAACTSTPTVKTDSDPAARFASYRSYTWIAKPTGGDPLTQQRIADGIDAKLQSKGWKLAPDGDVRVGANVTTQERRDYTTYYSGAGFGYGWGGFGPGVATTSTYSYEVGTLVVDMFDAKTKRAIWRGSASGTLPDNTDKLPALLQTSLDKMFAGFPPGSTPAK